MFIKAFPFGRLLFYICSLMSKALLILQDGTVFEGQSFGKIGTATGEICFNTGMTGYQEVFTDPSYFGQVLIMNSAHIGNYGAKATDVESESVKINGLICKTLSSKYSRDMADESLEAYLNENSIVSIHKIDTRALVTHIRQKGVMNCIISSDNANVEELKKELAAVPSMEGLELASQVSTKESYTVGDEKSSYRIAALDFGIKRNIVNCLAERGAFVKVFPAKSTFDQCEEFKPDAYFVSNGPGDPSTMDYAIDTVKQVMDSGKATFGICLGHQLISLACGATTFKMHNGHRGLNHPVINLKTMRSEISTQNHGFAVDPKSLEKLDSVEVTHKNLNDETIEGIRLKDKPVFCVQYHPEATPGPHDSRYLFDDFIAMINS